MVLEFLRVVAIAFRFAIRQLVILWKAFAERPSIIFDKVYLLWVGVGDIVQFCCHTRRVGPRSSRGRQ